MKAVVLVGGFGTRLRPLTLTTPKPMLPVGHRPMIEGTIAHLARLGIDPPEAVMTDNALAYRRSRAFAAAIERHGARHVLTPPYTPRWNGKVERFIQTLKREWAYAHSWPSSAERSRALASFLRYYNRRRPHSSLGDLPPISRVHNVRG